MYKAVLFDLDGTLTESGEGIVNSVKYALEKLGIGEINRKDLLCFVGPPLIRSFMKFYKFDKEQAEQGVRFYRERFGKIGIYENRLYPGIREMLEKLRNRGYRLAIASGKPEEYIHKILVYFEIESYFEVVTGSLMDGRRLAKSDVIEECLSRLGMQDDREHALMVGDREDDVFGARKAGVDCASVLYGYGSRKEIEAAGPRYIVSTVEELTGFLLSNLQAPEPPEKTARGVSQAPESSKKTVTESDIRKTGQTSYRAPEVPEKSSGESSSFMTAKDCATGSGNRPMEEPSASMTAGNSASMYGDYPLEERLKRQLDFSLEIDKEKNILRQTHLSGQGRRENDAEHAWHMAIMSYLFREYANEEVDIARVMLMCLIHDIVEIDAGDTYAYDEKGIETQKAREDAAKERIFSILPDDQRAELIALFDEFEACETPESRFAHAMDNLQPLILNNSNHGGDWREHKVKSEQIYRRQEKTRLGSGKLYEVVDSLIQKNIKEGNILP